MKKDSDSSHLVVEGLLDYLKETKQTEILNDVTEELETLQKKSSSAKEIIVTSAVSLDVSQTKRIQDAVNGYLKTNLPLKNKINSSVLGGFVVKVGDWYLDASLQKELNTIKTMLLT